MLDYVINHFERFIKSAAQEAILDGNPAPKVIGGQKVVDGYIREILLKATKSR